MTKTEVFAAVFVFFARNAKFKERSLVVKLSEVTVKVSSVIEDTDNMTSAEAEKTETASVGYLHIYDDGKALVTYTESGEGGQVTTEILVSGKTVTVSRRGAIESSMRFEEGVTHKSLYSIPPYRFDAEVRASMVKAEIYSEKGRIELKYIMKVGGSQRAARMKIWILPNSSLA